MKNIILFLLVAQSVISQTIPFQYGWPRQASGDWGLYSNSPTIADIDNDGILNISVTKSFATPELFVWKANGAYQSGFPVAIATGNLQNSGSIEISAFGDVDGDGKLNIVFGDENGQIFIYNHDGTLLGGAPINVGSIKESTTPALVDLDGDSTTEIIITSFDRESPYGNAQLHVFKWNGQAFVNFPNFPIQFTYGCDSAPVVGDIDNDGSYEIVYLSGGRVSDSTVAQINVIKLNGLSLSGFPIDNSYSSTGATPTLYDLDNDGTLEIIIKIKPISTNVNGIYAYNFRGALLNNFPFPVDGGHPYACVAIADMDGDSIPELAYGTGVAVDSGKVWVYKLDGTLFSNFPQKVFATWVDGAVCMADVSGDSLPDVIAPTNKGNIYAFDKNGNLVQSFPLIAENVHVVTGFETSPTVADIDGDGDTEIFAGSLNRRVYGYDTPGIWKPENVWLTYKGNAQRTGGQLKGYSPPTSQKDFSHELNFSLEQNYPNPFNPSTTIEFAVPAAGSFNVKVYDVIGREVATLMDKDVNAGNYKVTFDASRLASGIYIYRLVGNNVNITKKMMLIK